VLGRRDHLRSADHLLPTAVPLVLLVLDRPPGQVQNGAGGDGVGLAYPSSGMLLSRPCCMLR
jgi:hypothetical protein